MLRSVKAVLLRMLKAYKRYELRPIETTQPEDVFIVGYPKSGHTWMQNLVAGLAFGINPAVTPDSIIQELVPDVHYKQYYQRYLPAAFFKSHHRRGKVGSYKDEMPAEILAEFLTPKASELLRRLGYDPALNMIG